MRKQNVITPREYKIKRKRDTLACDYCQPHAGENCTHKKYSVKKKRKQYKE
jgi:hypothetical protein